MNSKIKERIKNKDKIILELGPGEKKFSPETIGIDIVQKESVDIIWDLNKGFSFIEDNVVDKIISHHVLEHIENLEFLMKESFRILKKNGVFERTVPHFSNPYFYSDYTHNKFFGLYSFNYFYNENNYFHRQVPLYYYDIRFMVEEIKLIFRSPFRIRNKVKEIFTKIVNGSNFFKEFYEENLVYIFPCYEIYFRLRK